MKPVVGLGCGVACGAGLGDAATFGWMRLVTRDARLDGRSTRVRRGFGVPSADGPVALGACIRGRHGRLVNVMTIGARGVRPIVHGAEHALAIVTVGTRCLGLRRRVRCVARGARRMPLGCEGTSVVLMAPLARPDTRLGCVVRCVTRRARIVSGHALANGHHTRCSLGQCSEPGPGAYIEQGIELDALFGGRHVTEGTRAIGCGLGGMGQVAAGAHRTGQRRRRSAHRWCRCIGGTTGEQGKSLGRGASKLRWRTTVARNEGRRERLFGPTGVECRDLKVTMFCACHHVARPAIRQCRTGTWRTVQVVAPPAVDAGAQMRRGRVRACSNRCVASNASLGGGCGAERVTVETRCGLLGRAHVRVGAGLRMAAGLGTRRVRWLRVEVVAVALGARNLLALDVHGVTVDGPGGLPTRWHLHLGRLGARVRPDGEPQQRCHEGQHQCSNQGQRLAVHGA
jgi:hypothetical protein